MKICWDAIAAYAPGRRLVLTERGCLALVPKLAQPGDVCCVLIGANIPCVLRPCPGGHRILGEAYVYQFMNGEVKGRVSRGELKVNEIVLY